MTLTEAGTLLAFIAVFDGRSTTTMEANVWSENLIDIPLDADVRTAVHAFYDNAPEDPTAFYRIRPVDVRRGRAKIRAKRLENFRYEPGPEDLDEDGAVTKDYFDRYREQREAIASGEVEPPEPLALEGGPHPDIADRLEGMLNIVPDDDESDAVKAAKAELRRGRPYAGVYGVSCPKCQARVGRRCGRNGKLLSEPHVQRIQAAESQ